MKSKLLTQILAFSVATAGLPVQAKDYGSEYPRRNNVYAENTYTPLESVDPGSMGGFILSYQIHGQNNPAIRIGTEIFRAQVYTLAAQRGGNINNIYEHEWITIKMRTNEAMAAMTELRDHANGNYEVDRATKDFVSGMVGVATGTAIASSGFGAAGAATGANIGTAATKYFLSGIESMLTDSVQIDAQGKWSQNLSFQSNIGELARLKMDCEVVGHCLNAYNGIFAHYYFNTSLDAPFSEWVKNDSVLRNDRNFTNFGRDLEELKRNGASKNDLKAGEQKIQDQLQQTEEVVRELANSVKSLKDSIRPKNTHFSNLEINDMNAHFLLAGTLSVLVGNSRVGNTIFSLGDMVTRTMQNYNQFKMNPTEMSQYAFTMNTFFFAVAAFNLISSLSNKGKSFEAAVMDALAQISKQIQDLHKAVISGFANTNASIFLSAGQTQAMVEVTRALTEIGNDYVKENALKIDYAEISNYKIAEAAQAKSKREWFDKCFTKNQDISKPIRSKCLKYYKNLAAEDSLYQHRRENFMTEPFFIGKAINDETFPLFDHLPLLWKTRESVDSSHAYKFANIANPRDWALGAVSYISLLDSKQNKSEQELQEQVADLSQLIKTGREMKGAILSLNFKKVGKVQQLDTELHEKLLKSYEQKLLALIQKTESVDVASGMSTGKRDIEGANQPYPVHKYDQFFNSLTNNGVDASIKLCDYAPTGNFIIQPSEVFLDKNAGKTVANQFGTFKIPNRQEVAIKVNKKWNKATIKAGKLALPEISEIVAIVPTPLIWAHMYNLGKLEICLNKYRISHYDDRTPIDKKDIRRLRRLEGEIDILFTPSKAVVTRFKEGGLVIHATKLSNEKVGVEFESEEIKSKLLKPEAIFIGRYGRQSKDLLISQRIDEVQINKGFWQYVEKVGANPKKSLPAPYLEFSKNIKNSERVSLNSGLPQLLPIISSFFGELNSEKKRKALGMLTETQEFRDALRTYYSYLIYVQIGFSQVYENKYVVTNLISKEVILSPYDLVRFIDTHSAAKSQAARMVTQQIARGVELNRRMSEWMRGLDGKDLQKVPVYVQKINPVLDRLQLMRHILRGKLMLAKQVRI